MRVVAQDSLRSPNPYTTQLYGSLQGLGAEVFDLRKPPVFGRRPDIIHVHWPDHLFGRHGKAVATGRFVAMQTYLRICLARGTKLVYTVHNLKPHDVFDEGYQRSMLQLVISRCHGWISLSQSASREVLNTYPSLASKPNAITPHGHYRGQYPDSVTREDARAELGIASETKVALLFGNLKAYKGVTELVAAFQSPVLAGTDRLLLIAGKAQDPDAIGKLASDNIRIFPGFVPTEKVQTYFRAADLTILPFRSILNSGSALLSLSFDIPIMAPALGSLTELEDALGSDSVRLYQGDIEPNQIAKELDRFHARPSRPLDLAAFDWNVIAKSTYDFYESLLKS